LHDFRQAVSLFDHARAALEGVPADLRMAEALAIVEQYSGALERAGRDAAALPAPKDTIKWALLTVLAATPGDARRQPLKAGYLGLAEWQDEASLAQPAFDSARLRRKLDPLALAREFAAHASPEGHRLEVVRVEQHALIEELKRRGFW
jgi:hypothetical protein